MFDWNMFQLTSEVDHYILLDVDPFIRKYNRVSSRAAPVRLLELEGQVLAIDDEVVVRLGHLHSPAVSDLGRELAARYRVEN